MEKGKIPTVRVRNVEVRSDLKWTESKLRKLFSNFITERELQTLCSKLNISNDSSRIKSESKKVRKPKGNRKGTV